LLGRSATFSTKQEAASRRGKHFTIRPKEEIVEEKSGASQSGQSVKSEDSNEKLKGSKRDNLVSAGTEIH